MDNHIAYIFQDDLYKLQTSECAATVYSFAMGDPDRGETVPLALAEQLPPAPVAEETVAPEVWIDLCDFNRACDGAEIRVFIEDDEIGRVPLYTRQQPAIDVDALAEFIRDIDDEEYIPYHEFAQRICNWIEELQGE